MLKPLNSFFFFLLFLVVTQSAMSQQTVQGKVTDNNTHEPLIGASIYIVESNKGTSTKEDGTYSISGLGKGSYQVIFSFLGYQKIVKTLVISSSDTEPTLDAALNPEPERMNEVVVSSVFINSQKENTYQVEVVNKNQMQKTGGVTVMDVIDKVAGVDAVTTGPMVSRPIIRGLQGNRVLTVVDGARFETQQWDDEHGIGVNELGMDHIEIIKGPASLLYGPEAMGGVVRFVDEQPAAVGTVDKSVLAALYSNNLGGRVNANLKGANENLNYGVNVIGKLLSDYFYDGYDFRVPNTRLLEFGGKGYVGINRKWGSSTVSYLFNQAYYGILDGKDIVRNEQGQIVNIDSLEKEKFPFEIEAPFHNVTDNRVNWKTTLLTGTSKIEAILGYQNNHRVENEELAGHKKGYTYLDMVLNSLTYDVKYHFPRTDHFETIIGVQGMRQTNANKDGAATRLIPDATINDIGFLGVGKYRFKDFTTSFGIRYDTRNLESKSFDDGSVAMPNIKRNYDNISTSLGVSYEIVKGLLLRASYASGYRSPNLNELFANGVKLENQRFERGNVDFKKETNNQFDFGVSYDGADFSIDGAIFWNNVNDFIYIAPTGTTIESNLDPDEQVPFYQFEQSDATLKGGEVTLDIHPSTLTWTHLETRFSTINAKQDDDSYLPMMPATKLTNTLYFNIKKFNAFDEVFFNIGTETAFEQTQVAANEETTPAYTLLNLDVGAHYHKTEFVLTANNVLDKAYLNHLSRFRSFDIIEPGINVSLSVYFKL
ncbi:MAG: TonB-dependent receptor [Gelidibacter sp.]